MPAARKLEQGPVGSRVQGKESKSSSSTPTIASNHHPIEEENCVDEGGCDKQDNSVRVVGSLQSPQLPSSVPDAEKSLPAVLSVEIELPSLVTPQRTSLLRDDNTSHHAHQSHLFSADPLGGETKPSNEKLLLTAFVSFMSFALVQFSFAFLADSEAMKGDSAAMMVDAMTYLCNWRAEYQKHHFSWETLRRMDHHSNNHNLDPSTIRRLKKREYRKMVLQMEILPPLLSVITLVLVTVWISYQAILILNGTLVSLNGIHPNIHLMMGFSIVNLGLDGINVFGFAKAKHLFGYLITSEDHHHGPDITKSPGAAAARSPPHHVYDRIEESAVGEPQHLENSTVDAVRNMRNQIDSVHDDDDGIAEGKAPPPPSPCCRDAENPTDDDTYCSDDDDDEEHHANLNMCSAYTHVFADTLRSIAVIIASTIASVVPGVTAEEADATAALAVSILIVLSLVPLLLGMIKSVAELRDIYAEEKFERLLHQEEEHDDDEDRDAT